MHCDDAEHEGELVILFDNDTAALNDVTNLFWCRDLT